MSHSPRLRINNQSAPLDRQECILRATNAAKSRKGRDLVSEADHPLLDCKTAVSEALRRAQEELEPGVDASVRHILSHLIITFGKYRGSTFRWLLENDVGYVK
jgi:hypothetical protein